MTATMTWWRASLLVILVLSSTAACTSVRKSAPQRTALEQLLISAAVDDALARLDLDIPAGTKVWLDTQNFEGYDQKYAIGAFRDHLLREGARLVGERGEADTVVEIRSGALSVDANDMLVGIPEIEVPIPLAGNAETPEVALLKKDQIRGVAKIGVTAYDAKSGALEPYSPPEPVYGFSHRTRWNALLVLGWTSSDVLPEGVDE